MCPITTPLSVIIVAVAASDTTFEKHWWSEKRGESVLKAFAIDSTSEKLFLCKRLWRSFLIT